MITINGFLHRQRFNDLIRRWLQDQPDPDDAELVGHLVHFNAVYLRRALDSFTATVLGALHPQPVARHAVETKREIKDALCSFPCYHEARIDALIGAYRERPELFYGETPIRGAYFTVERDGGPRFAGANRIKRVQRLAEKVARRVVDAIFTAIKQQADDLAEDRARRLGIPRDRLITDPREMINEFERAEQRILEMIRQHRPIPAMPEMVINDVAGLKVVIEDSERNRLLDVLAAQPGCEILEVEPHAGAYNATNLIVRVRPDKERLLRQPLSFPVLDAMRWRGYDPEETQQAFAAFVRSGEDSLHLELIFASYREVLESEIGRCMHEDRIIQQRTRQEYSGHLAKNIEYLVLYLFAFASSRQTRLDALPIKLWHRYLPDYFDQVTRKLHDLPEFVG